MFLRTYRREDKKQVQQLFFDTVHAVNANDYTEEQRKAWAPEEPDRESWQRLDEQYAYVVESKKKIVGFASVSHDGAMDFLYVHKDLQGKGIATALLKQLIRLARKKGFHRLTMESSITAKGFFEKMGFTWVQTLEKERRGVAFTCFLMALSLEEPAADKTV